MYNRNYPSWIFFQAMNVMLPLSNYCYDDYIKRQNDAQFYGKTRLAGWLKDMKKNNIKVFYVINKKCGLPIPILINP